MYIDISIFKYVNFLQASLNIAIRWQIYTDCVIYVTKNDHELNSYNSSSIITSDIFNKKYIRDRMRSFFLIVRLNIFKVFINIQLVCPDTAFVKSLNLISSCERHVPVLTHIYLPIPFY